MLNLLQHSTPTSTSLLTLSRSVSSSSLRPTMCYRHTRRYVRLLKSCGKSGRHQTRPLRRCTGGWWIWQKWQPLQKIKNYQHLGGTGGRLCAAMWRAQLQKCTGVARPFCPVWTTSSTSLRAASRSCHLLLFEESCCFLET